VGPTDDAHRLELLLAHHRPAAVLGGDVAIVALDGREADEVLPRGTDGVNGKAVAGQPVLLLQGLLCLPRVLALEMRGGTDLHRVVVDVEVRQRLGLSLDHDGVVARVLERGAEEAIGLRGGGAVGLRAARDDGQATRAPHGQSGQRAGGENEPVVGVIPVDLWTDLLVEDLGPEADSAQIVAHVLSPGLGPDLSRSQVHAQELARVAGHGRGRRRGLLLRSGRGRGGAHWTITWWGSWGEWEARPRFVTGRSARTVRLAR